MRINKYIAQAGICSRRKADELIVNGNVKVNGAVMKEPGYDVQEGDKVSVNGTMIEDSEKLVYYLLNKPVGFITTVKDEQDRATVMDLVGDIPERVFPVGRLDGNTSGALIMTNDGKVAYRIAHPKGQVMKTYHALVSGVVSKEKLWKLRNGIDIGGYVTKPARVTVIGENKNSTILEISISEGKNRQVRKMCKAVGNPVQELQRVSIGEVRLGRLKEGTFRKLTQAEIEYLKNC
ncbi:MAG: rRNA pseudouridine synthase [Firmicutes bacterium]|jgi:23S rRNA pseudouridine2605 synthase|nr:rRNA pseudouridine synthase [Bacillota bacterium]MBQ5441181.1 rRNA pseudouridine synthase [Bacillota bacterium]MCR4708871.1 rRNA pseudouridine synthase [Clostridiales bacterium]